MNFDMIKEVRGLGPYLVDVSGRAVHAMTNGQSALMGVVATDEFLRAATAARSLKTTWDVAYMPSEDHTHRWLNRARVERYALCCFVTEALRVGADGPTRLALESLIRTTAAVGYTLLLYAQIGFEEPQGSETVLPGPWDAARKRANVVQTGSFVVASVITSLAQDALLGLPPGVHLVGQGAYWLGTTLMVGGIALPIYENREKIKTVTTSIFARACGALSSTAKAVCKKVARAFSNQLRRPSVPDVRLFAD